MFELSVAFKYLTPRWRQLSVSIISLISILVIALVVWLIVVFFSVTHGLEKSWIQKLIALTAPVRITPTEEYYHSYYYQVDGISAASHYTVKTIGEKLQATQTNPYDPTIDGEAPADWKIPDNAADGHLKDIVKETFGVIRSIPGVQPSDFEMTAGNLRLRLVRVQEPNAKTQAFLSQAAYVGSLDPDNTALIPALLPLTAADRDNLLHVASTAISNIQEDQPEELFVTETKRSNAPSSLLVDTRVVDGRVQIVLPTDAKMGDGILLPRSFKDAGILVGDRGFLSYFAPTTSSVQEQRLPIYVAGFYDPGVIPIGGKFVLASREVTNLIRTSHNQEEAPLSNGINIRFANPEHADAVKTALLAAFEKEGLAPYWKVETYQEFDFTKDLIQQLHSERHLWTLIATVIIIVACSNIISMLIILVNDKKTEIGILRSMGASSASIAAIFGICGVVMGMIGSVIGIGIAILTLHNLTALLDLISRIQGYQVFNPLFYGNTLPSEISLEALAFVVVATSIISLLAGIIPAAKASLLKPSAILRAE